MGNVKRHNRTLPLHPDHAESMPSMDFFEKIIKDEVQKVVGTAVGDHIVNYYPERTTKLSDQLNHLR